MEMAMIFIGTGTVAWSLMRLIEALDMPKTKRETRRCGHNVRSRCGW